MKVDWKKIGHDIYNSVMMGISYMIPIVAIGGMLVGISMLIGGTDVAKGAGFATDMNVFGKECMALMLPVLGGFIAFGIADRPAIAAGMVAGIVAKAQGSGFLGAMAGAIFAGYLVYWLKQIKLPRNFSAILSVLIIPLISGFITWLAMKYILGIPATWLNTTVTNFLNSLQGLSPWVMGAIVGMVCQFDFGGPVSKCIGVYCLAAADAGNWMPMAVKIATACTPQFVTAIAIMIGKDRFTPVQRAGLPGLLAGGCCMILEFCIPYAAANPLRYMPATIVATAVTGAICMGGFGVISYATNGGLFVTPLMSNPVGFLISIVAGSVVGALLLLVLRKRIPAEPVAAE